MWGVFTCNLLHILNSLTQPSFLILSTRYLILGKKFGPKWGRHQTPSTYQDGHQVDNGDYKKNQLPSYEIKLWCSKIVIPLT